MDELNAGSQVVSPVDGIFSGETEEPPGTAALAVHHLAGRRRHPHWQDIPERLWQDWRWQRQHAVRTTAQLAELLPLPQDEIEALSALEEKYRLAIPPYYFSLIDLADPHDPIRLQAVPTSLEAQHSAGNELDDPLEEQHDSPVPGIIHRYPDRALVITTPVCSMYCRFCTRKRVTMDRDGWDAPNQDEQRMIEYVRSTPAIRDVILSGGDPLTLPLAKLQWLIEQLSAIEHVDVLRIGTRVPVTLPQRLFDPALVDLLARGEKIWIQTHFNHPREITPEAAQACRALVQRGMPVNNHAVLLKGVNDSLDTMRELVRQLLRIKVRPYYLFHCDPVTGAGHFRTSVWKGIELIEGLRGHVSGLGVPTYVVDGLHGAGKIPLAPNYLISASENAVVLRNYEGLLFRYEPENRPPPMNAASRAPQANLPASGTGAATCNGNSPASANSTANSQGISALLSAGGQPLVPANTLRQLRRQQHSLHHVAVEVISPETVVVSGTASRPAAGESAGGQSGGQGAAS